LLKNIKIKKNYEVRLDKYLKKLYTSLTQSFIEKNIRKKNILINNRRTSSNYLVKLNDNLNILNFHDELYKNKIIFKKNIKVSQKYLIKFEKSIIFQNKDFLVLNKWEDIATQGGSKINVSIDHIIKLINSDYRLVHRLDKETTGLLLISKNLKYAKYFSSLFKQKNIKKFYLALCEGKPKNNLSKVNLILKNKKLKTENTSTNYKLLSNNNMISQLLYNPTTGKTHQLRIVSKNLGCPIIGDKKYNGLSKFRNEKLMLHAYGLKFSIENKFFEYFVEIPDHFLNFIKKNNLTTIRNYKTHLESF
tara:strand:+ start:2172 stop:3086 length:915 start_codon:yes stop_codon:yes gene_type:complete